MGILLIFAAINLKAMPYRCKICGKTYMIYYDTLTHVKEEHHLSKEDAKKEVYHTTPGIEKRLERERQQNRRWQQIKNIKYACIHGFHYPAKWCQCPICGAEHSKSYSVFYDSPKLRVQVRICRNCFKALVNGPQSVYSKSVYDGDYESNK